MIAEQPIQTNRYPQYKDSGLEWIGEIPAHWEVGRIKYVCKINQRSLPESTAKSFPIHYVDIGSVTLEEGIVQTEEFEFKNAPSRARRIANAGDTIISTVRTYLKAIAFVDEQQSQFIYSTGFAVLNPLPLIMPKFLAMAVKSDSFTEQVSANSKGMSYPAINSTELGCLAICFPPLSEQTRIAEFLDRKTAQIDQAIAQKEQLIELLNERRQVMIHRAVTRGLNPNAPMKDSGIDRGDARWIGEIPAHWEVSRINWLFTEKDETGYPDLPLLIVSINSGVTVRDMDDTEIRKQVAEDFNVYKRALAGDIAFNKMRMWQGAVGVVPQDGLVSPDYVVARPNNFVNSAYYGFLFKTREYLAEFVKHSHGIAWDRNRLYWEDFKSIFAMVPPLEEQNQIVDFLNAQNEEMSFASTKIQKQIQKLQELKSTLINSAVTGKIKV
ncbi:restriction endonuclease subunit S [Spirosoma linguale]